MIKEKKVEECTWEWCVFWYWLFTECLVLCEECVKLFLWNVTHWGKSCVCGSQRHSWEIAACKELEMSFSLSSISGPAACSVHSDGISSSHVNAFQSKHLILLQGEFLFCLFPVQCTLTNIKTGMLRAAFPTVECMEKEKPFSSSPPSNPQLQFALFLGQEKR